MASRLVPCPGCTRHVKVGGATCPFCGADVPADVPLPPARSALIPLTRAALVFGGLASVGMWTDCSSSSAYGVFIPDDVSEGCESPNIGASCDGGTYSSIPPSPACCDGGAAFLVCTDGELLGLACSAPPDGAVPYVAPDGGDGDDAGDGGDASDDEAADGGEDLDAEIAYEPACSTELPASCSGQVYVIVPACDGICGTASVTFYCNASTFSQSSCLDPPPGWLPYVPPDSGPDGG